MNQSRNGPKSRALDGLRQAVEALRPHLTTPEEQANLFLIDEAAVRLADTGQTGFSGLMDFDPTRLSHLLEITGPDLAVELLARLTEDLTATQEKLDQGAATADWKHLREGSHVLISLSGSVGAMSLQTMAENLNAIAHRQESDALTTLMPPLGAELSSLIQLIRATQPPNRTY
jgi:HPt (histidine-containing phosphotransfer) domain-containing protein